MAPFPQNSFRLEYKLRSSLSIHTFHRTDSKDPDIYAMRFTHPACTIHEDGIALWLDPKKGHVHKNLPKMNPRDMAGNAEEEKKTKSDTTWPETW